MKKRNFGKPTSHITPEHGIISRFGEKDADWECERDKVLSQLNDYETGLARARSLHQAQRLKQQRGR